MASPDPLTLCAACPERRVPAGTVLVEEGVRTERLYVLKSGSFEVVRGGVRVVAIAEPGSFLGEISAVLATTPTASVIAECDSTVLVIEQAGAAVQRDPALTFAIAQLLARRLLAVTSYLVDIKRQYAGSNTHLALMDQVLANLSAMQPGDRPPAGSERTDVPDY